MYRDLGSANPANLSNAHNITEQVIFLPIYPELSTKQVNEIMEKIKGFKV
jgi:dTDP-4-amino-4,6-dideoxygalactose transaminase